MTCTAIIVSASAWVGFTLPGIIGEPGSRPARHQPNVIGNLVERHRQRSQRAGKPYQVIVGSLHRELVRCADERQARELRNFASRRFPESWSCIDSGTNGCSTE